MSSFFGGGQQAPQGPDPLFAGTFCLNTNITRKNEKLNHELYKFSSVQICTVLVQYNNS